ncbi:MAG TPA: VTT domain-containing protein [Patescibacteria group bacterium]|nr:VTT domain-containing protein [Patescibacteria group bacterium]
MLQFLQKHKKAIIIVAILIFTTISIWYLNRHHVFNRRELRELQNNIKSYGSFSAVAIIVLVLISTLVPPLPIPVPLVEIVCGLIFGFIPGMIINYLAQIISSSIAFYLARILGRKFFRKILDNKIFTSYKKYINKNGSVAVLTLRATIGAPFNMVSFLAGLTEMNFKSFLIATLLGCIPEVILFTFIGNALQTSRFRISYVFLFVILLGGVGMLTTLWVLRRKK